MAILIPLIRPHRDYWGSTRARQLRPKLAGPDNDSLLPFFPTTLFFISRDPADNLCLSCSAAGQPCVRYDGTQWALCSPYPCSGTAPQHKSPQSKIFSLSTILCGALQWRAGSREKVVGRDLMVLERRYYDLLQVEPTADLSTIRASYRRLAKQLHPDRNPAAGPAAFQQLAAAFGVLSDPARRVLYDREGESGIKEARTSPTRQEDEDEESQVDTDEEIISQTDSDEVEEDIEEHEDSDKPGFHFYSFSFTTHNSQPFRHPFPSSRHGFSHQQFKFECKTARSPASEDSDSDQESGQASEDDSESEQESGKEDLEENCSNDQSYSHKSDQSSENDSDEDIFDPLEKDEEHSSESSSAEEMEEIMPSSSAQKIKILKQQNNYKQIPSESSDSDEEFFPSSERRSCSSVRTGKKRKTYLRAHEEHGSFKRKRCNKFNISDDEESGEEFEEESEVETEEESEEEEEESEEVSFYRTTLGRPGMQRHFTQRIFVC